MFLEAKAARRSLASSRILCAETSGGAAPALLYFGSTPRYVKATTRSRAATLGLLLARPA